MTQYPVHLGVKAVSDWFHDSGTQIWNVKSVQNDDNFAGRVGEGKVFSSEVLPLSKKEQIVINCFNIS
jgi:hypothetical protein